MDVDWAKSEPAMSQDFKVVFINTLIDLLRREFFQKRSPPRHRHTASGAGLADITRKWFLTNCQSGLEQLSEYGLMDFA